MPVNMDFIREFGLQAGLLFIFAGVMVWLVKTSFSHFISAIDKATEERQKITKDFTLVIENHMAHSTEALNNLCGQTIESRKDHTRFEGLLEKIGEKY